MDTLWPGKTKRIVCPRCDGAGEYDVKHAAFGASFCPDPYVTERCTSCDGEGRLVVPVRDDIVPDDEPPGEEED